MARDARLIALRSCAMASTVELYGIKNCDTVKKARVWLEGQGIAFVFHDYKLQRVVWRCRGLAARGADHVD